MHFGEIVKTYGKFYVFLGEASLNNIHFTKYSPMNYGETDLLMVWFFSKIEIRNMAILANFSCLFGLEISTLICMSSVGGPLKINICLPDNCSSDWTDSDRFWLNTFDTRTCGW